jgi:hypothetical protein
MYSALKKAVHKTVVLHYQKPLSNDKILSKNPIRPYGEK